MVQMTDHGRKGEGGRSRKSVEVTRDRLCHKNYL